MLLFLFSLNTLIIYHTKTGHPLAAINPFVESIKAEGVNINIVKAKDFEPDVIHDCNAFVVGTPCWKGSTGLGGVASPLVNVLKKLPHNSLKGKICGGIAVHAKYG